MGSVNYWALSMTINSSTDKKKRIDFVKIKFHLNDIPCILNWMKMKENTI